MPEKVGKDVIKQKRRLKRKLEEANRIEIQMKVLEELAKKPMTSAELRQFIESLGGNHYLMLPILKNSGLIEVKRVTSKQGTGFVYSLKKL